MKVSNPLTIIAIFSGTAEVFATGALIGLPLEMQSVFIYFVMLFPLVIVITFFCILVLKPYVLYAPSDFDNQKHFLELNSIRDVVEETTENAIKDAASKGQKIDPKEISKIVAASTVDKLENSLNDQIYTYLKEHPSDAFTAGSLGALFSTSRNMITISLYYLESVGLINKRKDEDIVVWQMKT
jgi:hypothetical protein